MPKILRLYGRGEVRDRATPHTTSCAPLPTCRENAIIDISVGRIADSCGFGVPRMDFVGARDRLLTSAERKGPEKMAEYRIRPPPKNTRA